MGGLLGLVLTLAALLVPAGAQAANVVTLPASPVKVIVGDTGRLQANVVGRVQNVFFPSASDDGAAGFFLGFPDAFGDRAAGSVVGPSSQSGATFFYDLLSFGAVTGNGSSASPYTQFSTFAVNDGSANLMSVDQRVSVVNGTRNFRVTYTVHNLTGSPIRFRASTGADLYLEGSDQGSGFFAAGPPRRVGGLSPTTGSAGGIEEVIAPGFPRWSRYQESRYSEVFVNIGAPLTAGLDNTIDPATVDNGVGVQWDDRYDTGLAGGATAQYSAIWTFGSPPPLLGTAANVEPVKGQVFVKFPGTSGAASAAQKGQGFIPLQEARQIPIGSLLDTSKGTVRLTTASTSAGKVLSGDFSAGVFQVLQSRKRSQKGLTELRLKGSSFKACKAVKGNASARTSRRFRTRIRSLRGNAKGRFRTRGRYSSATVRGTKWTTTDRCDGTLTSVQRGRVDVRDFKRRKTIKLKTGKRYLAKAPG
jgi:hypothetical protein